MIPVTKSFLPPIAAYMTQVERAYEKGWLTNRGMLVLELEAKLKSYLNLTESEILLMNNGTIPLQIALKLLGNGGEVITTPFSYVATTASIVWEGCTPVFVDIHPAYLTIDETKIEAAITDKTTCILATHVYGNPCNVIEIDRIAKKYGLKVIYDAAHAFGVQYNGKSIFEYGDLSTCSFHATKIFHTGEGGAVFCKDKNLFHQLYYSHNFGHDGTEAYHGLGINGKMSELQSAMGLAVLPYMNEIIESRNASVAAYDTFFQNELIEKIKIRESTVWNSSYYPILFKSEIHLKKVEEQLISANIFPRRYFYPSLDTLPYVSNTDVPISRDISSRVLCLPLYYGLLAQEIHSITHLINNQLEILK